ncbi:MAG: XRE family transcriptional regulator [Pseudomonadota bacterium]
MNDQGSIGERIRSARKAKGFSQADLARRIGVSQPAIATWESGVHDPRRLVLAKLADALSTPLEWLAAGARSRQESDKHAAAAYLRRPLQHVPLISLSSAVLLAGEREPDPHAVAEDYIPVTAGETHMFAVFADDPAIDLAFPSGSLVVIDYADRAPQDGAYCLAVVSGKPVLRRWRQTPDRLETYASSGKSETTLIDGEASIVGCARVSIRFH